MVSRPGADANMYLFDSRVDVLVDVLVDVQHTGSSCNSVVKIKPWPFSIRTSQNNVGTPSPRNTAVGNVSVGNNADS
jgi:hypothetical protein